MGRVVNVAATFQKDVLIFITLKFSGFPLPPLLEIKLRAFYILPKSSTTELSFLLHLFFSDATRDQIYSAHTKNTLSYTLVHE